MYFTLLCCYVVFVSFIIVNKLFTKHISPLFFHCFSTVILLFFHWTWLIIIMPSTDKKAFSTRCDRQFTFLRMNVSLQLSHCVLWSGPAPAVRARSYSMSPAVSTAAFRRFLALFPGVVLRGRSRGNAVIVCRRVHYEMTRWANSHQKWYIQWLASLIINISKFFPFQLFYNQV